MTSPGRVKSRYGAADGHTGPRTTFGPLELAFVVATLAAAARTTTNATVLYGDRSVTLDKSRAEGEDLWVRSADLPRINEFEALAVPVDAYGVGSSLIRGQNDFTADVVLLEGRPCAKVGRTYSPNPRMERVE